ncbi:MAG: amidohydrolase family protein [Planctomycetota bacterium]|nr:amidohydrolase family protein [Planctomycetota bacterium]
MIIDAQTRIWPSVDRLGRESADIARREQATRWIRESADPGQLELDLDPIDAALVFGYRCERQDSTIANEWIAEVVGRSRNRLMGVAGIDPMSTDALEEIDRAVDMGFVGVTVCPSDQGFHPTNSTAMRVWERCQHLGLPIFVSRPGPPCPGAILEFDRPLNWDEVARSIPELPIVLGGIGTPWVEETLLLLQKHPRIFADTAGLIRRPWHLFQALLGASSMGVTDKVLFASGWPVETPSKAIETIYSVNSFSQGTQLPSIPRPQLRAIVERDLPTVLGLPIAPSVSNEIPSSQPLPSSEA